MRFRGLMGLLVLSYLHGKQKMTHKFYRGDNRSIEVLKRVGFQPMNGLYRRRSCAGAVEYIKSVMEKNKSWTRTADFGNYIISRSKGDSVSASRILDGAVNGRKKYSISCPGDAMFFEFMENGTVGPQIADPIGPNDRKPYYILNNIIVHNSSYVVVGTMTDVQEATFFTDIPPDWIAAVPK